MAAKYDDNITGWITVGGRRVPIRKGQSKADAVKGMKSGGGSFSGAGRKAKVKENKRWTSNEDEKRVTKQAISDRKDNYKIAKRGKDISESTRKQNEQGRALLQKLMDEQNKKR